MIKRARAAVEGIVQGVGFRPFVYQLASRYGLTGHVANTPMGVIIEVEGVETAIQSFALAVQREHPPLAYIANVRWEEIRPENELGFTIRESRTGEERSALISPDVSICAECLAEMRDPANRRFRYPFINCTNCGPRYTIITDIPYDRSATTMNRFTMCPACRAEYEDPSDRRFHAQPNACWECGPRVSLHDGTGRLIPTGDPVQAAIALLQEGRIVAVKGLGGFHLVVDACNHAGVVRLRRQKQREEKPLAVMVRDMEAARAIVHMDDRESDLLSSRQRPIVLLKKRRSHGLSPQVAPRNPYLGVMLPYTPLHYLLMEGPFRALVMTSGNLSEEPICIDNDTAFQRLKGIADYFLTHDRDIYLRSDDSVLRVVDGVPRQIRRSRGYVPMPIFLPEAMGGGPPVLAVGGELKNTICLTKGNRAFLSQHIGDMENLETLDFFLLTVTHLKRILEIEPEVVAHDLHPDYLSTRFALEQGGKLPLIGVQHHHAHIVSCMAENGLVGPVIGVAMDGTGMGLDGQIWGGEILLSDLTSFERIGHLDYVPLPGGDAAARHPWRMALVYLDRAFGDGLFDLAIPFVRALHRSEAAIVLQMALKGVRSPQTSSCGRLFDAVSALLGLRRTIAYEGQAAVELEMAQTGGDRRVYSWEISQEGGAWIMKSEDVIRGIVRDIQKGEGRGVIARRFHNTLIQMLADACARTRDQSGISQVALSGGAFQNRTLLAGLTQTLKRNGFQVVTQARVPSNDGGLCLGQAVCAGLRHLGMRGRFGNGNEVHG